MIKFKTICFKYPVKKHVRKDMMVQTFLNAICCPMSCSKGGRHVCTWNGKRSHATLKCCWKGKLSTHVKASKKQRCWSTMNLTAMIEATKAQLPK